MASCRVGFSKDVLTITVLRVRVRVSQYEHFVRQFDDLTRLWQFSEIGAPRLAVCVLHLV